MKTVKRKSVFLDLDDTILDFKTAERTALDTTFRRIGLEPTDAVAERYSEINMHQWEKLELGLITRAEVLSSRFDLLFAEMGVVRSGDEAQRIYEKLLEKGHWFMPGARELLDGLYGKYDLYIISNGSAAVQDSRLESAGIAPLFRGIFISERIGAEKPSRAFFDKCFQTIPGFDPKDAVIIGDSLTSDIKGGINMGITTCWYNYRGRPPRSDIVPDYTVSELSAIPALLDSIFSENE